MIDGKKLRKEKLDQRDGLSEDEVEKKSKVIEGKLLELDDIKKGLNIFIYVNFRSEVKTTAIIDNLLKIPKNVSVPITYVKERRLDAIQIKNMSQDLVAGYCGIPEPKKSLCINNITSPEDIDVVIIPGSVFDERGGRFGYGGGFYDRFVSAIPAATRIGLAFDTQMVDQLALQAHDELLDCVVSPSAVYRAKR